VAADVCIDARQLYEDLHDLAVAESQADTLGWLATAGYSYQALRDENAPKVRGMSLKRDVAARDRVQSLALTIRASRDF
jgi:hypothetical protein